MSRDSFWDSVEGAGYRALWRELTTARGGVSVKPKAKGSGGAARERAMIVAATEEWKRAYRGGGWPRPRADVALDVWAVSGRNAPQPQNFAKRLLDQLGSGADGKPIVYQDDRQVSMLYVRVDEIANGDPHIYFAAQRSAVIRDEMRRTTDDDDGDDDDYWDQQREIDARLEFSDDAIADWREDTSEIGQRLYAMAVRSKRFDLQDGILKTTDHLARALVQSFATVPPRCPEPFLELTADALDLLGSMPYALSLGQLPSKPGETETFKASIRMIVADRIAKFPYLYPPDMPVGLTAFFVPGAGGKDLDNIFRQLVVPALLEHIHLPRLRQHHFVTLADDSAGEEARTPPHIEFIEGVALKGVPRPPGTVVIALSNGERHESWWQMAIDRDRRHGDY